MATKAAEISNLVPALTAERPVTWPKRTRTRLANGLQVVLAEAHSIPKFHGELFFRAGNALVVDRARQPASSAGRPWAAASWPIGLPCASRFVTVVAAAWAPGAGAYFSTSASV